MRRLGLLGGQSKMLARTLDRVEPVMRRAGRRVEQVWRRRSRTVQAAVVLVAVSLAGCVGYGAWKWLG